MDIAGMESVMEIIADESLVLISEMDRIGQIALAEDGDKKKVQLVMTHLKQQKTYENMSQSTEKTRNSPKS